MQKPRGLDSILDRLGNTVKDSFEKIKGNIGGFPKYLKEIEYKTYIKKFIYLIIINIVILLKFY